MSGWREMSQNSISDAGSWKPMRTEHSADKLPAGRGRYLLWLEPPLVSGSGHWVHFSWVEESFCIRDYINGVSRRQDPKTDASEIWRKAKDRIHCRGELHKPVQDFEFWKRKLKELTEDRPL